MYRCIYTVFIFYKNKIVTFYYLFLSFHISREHYLFNDYSKNC